MILADWLKENGEEALGEFIQVQCEMASSTDRECGGFSLHKSHCVCWTPGREACNRARIRREKEKGLFTFDNLERWGCHRWERNCLRLDELEHLPGDITAVLFRRGFISRVRCPLNDWERLGPSLVGRHPIERVDVTDDDFTKGAIQWTTCTRNETILAWFIERVHLGLRSWYYPTEEDLRNNISDELILWARVVAEDKGLLP